MNDRPEACGPGGSRGRSTAIDAPGRAKYYGRMELIHTDTYRIDSYAVDNGGTLALPVLFGLFQESAYRNAEELQFGYSHLGERRQLWALSRMLVRAYRYPNWGETIRLETWPKGTSRMFALRDFLVKDAGDRTLFAATSAWLVLDAETRRIQRLEGLFEGKRLPLDRHALTEEAAKIAAPEGEEETARYTVRYSDIDVNGHVNNARYIAWVLDSYPMERFETSRPSLLEVNFLAETRFGEQVRILSGSAPESNGTAAPVSELHRVVRLEDERELCRIRLEWTGRSVNTGDGRS